MTEPNLPDFSGKLVAFYVSNRSRGIDNGVVMEFVEFKRFDQRLFLVGRVPEVIGVDWAARVAGAIAWDSVVHYLVFESREDYQRRMPKPSFLKRLLERVTG